jgi:hypothetical protein
MTLASAQQPSDTNQILQTLTTLSGILTEARRISTSEFARKFLCEPLGSRLHHGTRTLRATFSAAMVCD